MKLQHSVWVFSEKIPYHPQFGLSFLLDASSRGAISSCAAAPREIRHGELSKGNVNGIASRYICEPAAFRDRDSFLVLSFFFPLLSRMQPCG
jgi:hypothetical protein